MAKKPADKSAPAAPQRDPEEQVSVRFTDEVRLAEWQLTFSPGDVTTLKASLLADSRVAGKYEEL